MEPADEVEVMLRGVATSGVGRAASFTSISWVVAQFVHKLGLRPWPGTFNVRVADPESRALWAQLTLRRGIQIEPPDATACVAHCYSVVLNDRIHGAIIVPHVPGYPADQIEVIAAQCIRASLQLADGDPVTLRVLRAES